jgi:glycosyltransferase involved in cell wall biosynthesis
MFAVNGRLFADHPTEMQKYAGQLIARFRSAPTVISPATPLKGIKGHLWEQSVLPTRVPGGLLWSPCGTGPLALGDQVVTVHDLIPLDRPEWFGRGFAALHAWLVARLVKRVRHVITVSEFTRQRLMELFEIPASRITAIHNGVGEEYFRRSPFKIEQMRKGLSIPEGDYVLSVCSLEPRKNLARLLAAWERIDGQHDAKLVIVGVKRASSVFRDMGLSRVPSGVYFMGNVAEEMLPALYAGASCFAYPSLYEGFGLPVLEAMACGALAVTSNATALPEITGSAAILVDPENADQIAGAILGVLKHPGKAETLAESGRKHASQFTWAECARRTELLLLSLR